MQLTGPQSINYTSDGQTPLELRASIFDMAGVQVTRGILYSCTQSVSLCLPDAARYAVIHLHCDFSCMT